MKRVISAGGIVFKDGQVLSTKTPSMRDLSKKHWGFPKGHVEEGEKSEVAALREVEEETGVKARVIKKIGDTKYTFLYKQRLKTSPKGSVYKDQKIFKIVIWFLMEYESGNLSPQPGEIEEVRWFTPEEALVNLSFPQDKKLLQKALEIKNG